MASIVDYSLKNAMLEARIKEVIRDIQDFPKEGIDFKDITPILSNPKLVVDIIQEFKRLLIPIEIDSLACIESRGFWFGTILAFEMGLPIVPIRKKGKLPHKTVSVQYDLEYGSATIEAHEDAILKGHRVFVHDDLLATGGTAAATADLVQKSGGIVAGFSFLVYLSFLNGKEKLSPFSSNVISLVNY